MTWARQLSGSACCKRKGAQDYRRCAEGRLERAGAPLRLESCTVTALPPALGDIHQVFNAYDDRISMAFTSTAPTSARSTAAYLPWSRPSSLSVPAMPTTPGQADITIDFDIMTKNLMHTGQPQFPYRSYQQVRDELLARREIAMLDVREEAPHAQAHPLSFANLPHGRIELDAYIKPLRDVPIVLLDGGEGLAVSAATRLRRLGYTDVSLLTGGVTDWQAAGGELFRDVNVPSKAFGELVGAERHTPSQAALKLQPLIDGIADIVILDARRYEKYQTMSIPGSISVPGALA